MKGEDITRLKEVAERALPFEGEMEALKEYMGLVGPSRVLSLLTELMACREALKPFADRAAKLSGVDSDRFGTMPTSQLTIGDFRRAASAMGQRDEGTQP